MVKIIKVTVLASAMLTGFVVMAFEMLLGHFLNPYFGSSIMTWGAIISTVLIALSVGYFYGGILADRFPHGLLIGTLLCFASIYLFAIPFASEFLLLKIATDIEDTRLGALLSAIIFALPLIPLGMYCPFAIRLMVPDREHAGGAAGMVYGVSTLGSIVGTLLVSFFLVLYMGSRNITVLLAALTLLVGVVNIAILRPVELQD